MIEGKNDVEAYLAPLVALKFIQQTIKRTPNTNILLIFDDVMLHNFKERAVFDLANQPFSPINILNEIYQNTGIFENYELTSLMMLDDNNSSEMFRLDEI